MEFMLFLVLLINNYDNSFIVTKNGKKENRKNIAGKGNHH